jgi:hypothetical protein
LLFFVFLVVFVSVVASSPAFATVQVVGRRTARPMKTIHSGEDVPVGDFCARDL